MKKPHRDTARRAIFTTLLTLPVFPIAAAGYWAGIASLTSTCIMIPFTLMVAFTYASYLENKAKSLEETFKNYRCLSWLLNRCARPLERALDFLFNGGCTLTVVTAEPQKHLNPSQMDAVAQAVPAIGQDQDALDALSKAQFSGGGQVVYTAQGVLKGGVLKGHF